MPREPLSTSAIVTLAVMFHASTDLRSAFEQREVRQLLRDAGFERGYDSIYAALQQLVRKGYVLKTLNPNCTHRGARGHLYSVTNLGEAALHRHIKLVAGIP